MKPEMEAKIKNMTPEQKEKIYNNIEEMIALSLKTIELYEKMKEGLKISVRFQRKDDPTINYCALEEVFIEGWTVHPKKVEPSVSNQGVFVWQYSRRTEKGGVEKIYLDKRLK